MHFIPFRSDMHFIPLQKSSDFDGFMTLKESNLWYKFEGPSCYGNQAVYSFRSTMV